MLASIIVFTKIHLQDFTKCDNFIHDIDIIAIIF